MAIVFWSPLPLAFLDRDIAYRFPSLLTSLNSTYWLADKYSFAFSFLGSALL